jgi:hypothetical protein
MIVGVRRSRGKADVARIAFEAYGVHVEASVTPAAELDRLRALLPPGWRPCPASAVRKRFAIRPDATGTYALHKDDERFVDALGLDLALELLEAQVRAYVALHAPDRIFVHAGVVGHRGRAIVIPGMSFSGKTTLVAALVGAGATYYSDEFAPLDENGLVHPYAKPLSVRDDRQVQHDHDVKSMGGTVGEEPLRVGAVVATEYIPGAQWRPRRLSPGEGVLALLSHTVAAQTRPKQVMRFLSGCVDGALAVEGPRDDAVELAPLLLAELER